jgi:hypothetical protein
MEEKPKRKEKPKRLMFSRPFIGMSVILLLVFFAGFLLWIPDSCACSPLLSEEERTAISATNSMSLTQISATATQAAMMTQTASSATQSEPTLLNLFQTATALDLLWPAATPE